MKDGPDISNKDTGLVSFAATPEEPIHNNVLCVLCTVLSCFRTVFCMHCVRTVYVTFSPRGTSWVRINRRFFRGGLEAEKEEEKEN